MEFTLTSDQRDAVGDLLKRTEQAQNDVLRHQALALDTKNRDDCFDQCEAACINILGLPGFPAQMTEIHLEYTPGPRREWTGKVFVNQEAT